MKAEHDRAITEAMRIRDNYARSALEAASAVNQTIQKIDQVQSDKVVNFQLETLKKRALKYERQLVEATEKHEEELKEKELLCDKQKKEFLKERKRNKELEEELRAFEDSVMNGTALPKEKMLTESPDSSPEVPNPKRARADVIDVSAPPLSQLGSVLDKLSETSKLIKEQTVRTRAFNKKIEDICVEPVRVDKTLDRGKEIIERGRRFMEEGWETKADNVMTSAYSQSLRDNANLLVITKDARSIKSSGQQVSGDKNEYATRGLNMSPSSSQQANQSDNGGYNEPGPPLVTKEQRDKSMKLWKEALIHSNIYAPRLNLPKEEHLQTISFLIAAMVAFRNANLKGERAHTWEHGQYGPLQKKLHIPRIYCPMDKYFDQVAKYPDAVYKVRCCPLFDYYQLLCRDTPVYVSSIRPPVRHGGNSEKTNPRDYRPPRAHQGFSPKSSVNTWGAKPEGTVMAPLPNVPALSPSSFDEEQIESADKAERRRIAPKKNAPIPEDEDSTETDGETTNCLFEDKMLPEDKATILRLNKDIKRIKAQNYSADYLRKRDKAIAAAEAKRLAGKVGPAYLFAGVKFPWSSDHGHAPREYDDDQVDKIKEQIDNIKRTNAELCQLEYTATKGGPGGQARR